MPRHAESLLVPLTAADCFCYSQLTDCCTADLITAIRPSLISQLSAMNAQGTFTQIAFRPISRRDRSILRSSADVDYEETIDLLECECDKLSSSRSPQVLSCRSRLWCAHSSPLCACSCRAGVLFSITVCAHPRCGNQTDSLTLSLLSDAGLQNLAISV